MQSDRWQRVKTIYHAALDRPLEDRAAYLEDACRGDPGTLDEVRSLLSRTSDDSFLEKPAWRQAASRTTRRARRARAPSRRRHPITAVVWSALVVVVVAFGYAAWHISRSGADPTYETFNFLTSLTWCAIGLFIGFARPDEWMARLAFGAAVLTGLVFVQVVEMPGLYALQPLHVVLGFHFFYLFPGEPPRARGWRTVLRLLYAGTAICMAYAMGVKWVQFGAGIRAWAPWLGGPIKAAVGWVSVAVGMTSMFGAVILAALKYRALTDADKRRRFHWVALGGVVGLPPSALEVPIISLRADPAVAGWLLPGRSWHLFDMVATGLSVAIPVSVAYVVVKHGVWGVKVAIRRGLQYLLARRALQILLAVPVGVLLVTVVRERHRTIAELVTGSRGALFWILAFALSLRFRRRALSWLDRRFFHEEYDGERLVLEFVDALNRFDSAEQMTAFLGRKLARSLHPRSMYLWWRRSGVMTMAETSDPALRSAPLPVSESLVERLTRHDVLARLDRGLVSLLKECPACGACYDSDAEDCPRDGSPLTLTLPVARVIDGKYRLERLIGRGGMGAVYEARDLRLDREVALKVMIGGAFGHESALRRFRREAQAVARLNHPNIVAVYDFGEFEGGGAYLVMERLRGATLRAEMTRVGAFTPAAAAEWFEPMLDGLAAAHEQGIVHRDFKPENVSGRRGEDGRLAVKILDFGLAKIRPRPAAAPAADSVTESGAVPGTLACMAPEQFRGREVDARADVYSAGVILAEMLTRSRPFADGAEVGADWRLPDDVPDRASLDAVVRRCLAFAPGERFASAAELRAAIVPALRHGGRG